MNDPTHRPRTSVHSSIAREIGLRILRGDYPPGVALPNEAEWGRIFHASRSAVREAIKTLAAKGLIVSRPKIGSRVEKRERWNLLDRDVLAWYSALPNRERLMLSIQQMRYIFEPEAAALAALNHDEAQMAEIDKACAEMGSAPSQPARTEADVRFHLAILSATGNEFLVPFSFLIESALANVFEFTTRQTADFSIAQALHENIAHAIRARKPDLARRAVVKLLRNTDEVIARSAGASRRKPVRSKELAVG
jgi:DNA-binding FadR family transcriptional regulator